MRRSTGFTAEEKAAMQERAREVKGTMRRESRAAQVDGEDGVLAKLAEMQPSDRAIGERLHALIKASVPVLSPRTWYGMPAYEKDGKMICFFQPGQKFKTRYSTFGFSDAAKLDEGTMWPNAYALMELSPADEKRIVALLKKAVTEG